MRISDWSSDVCSSDLPSEAAGEPRRSLLAVLHLHGAAADAAPEIADFDAGSQNPAIGERPRYPGDSHGAPAGNHASAGFSAGALYRHYRRRGCDLSQQRPRSGKTYINNHEQKNEMKGK